MTYHEPPICKLAFLMEFDRQRVDVFSDVRVMVQVYQ